MLAVQGRQTPADMQPQPEQRRDLRVGEVGVEVLGDVEEGLLDDIRGVEPGAEPGVETQLDHAAESIAVVVEERRQRLSVAAAERVDRVVRAGRRFVHRGPPTPIMRPGRKSGTNRVIRDRRGRWPIRRTDWTERPGRG